MIILCTMPKIVFEINPSKIKKWIMKCAELSKKFKRSGIDIFKSDVKNFPELYNLQNLPKSEWKTKIDSVIDPYYQKIYKKMIDSKKRIEKNWRKIEDIYFEEAAKLFKHPWPKGKYKAILSVLNGYPWSYQEKEFHIPWKDFPHIKVNYVIIHETLHILFYDFWKKHFEGALKKDLFWDLSEILNVIIQNKEPFLTFGGMRAVPYPYHLEQYEILKKIFEKSTSMKEFCKKAIKFIKMYEKKNGDYIERLKRAKTPKVVETLPKANQNFVNPRLKEIIIKFNIKMNPFCGEVFTKPQIKIARKYWENNKVLHIFLKEPLKRNTEYKMELNTKDVFKFRSYKGKLLPSYVFKFKTR